MATTGLGRTALPVAGPLTLTLASDSDWPAAGSNVTPGAADDPPCVDASVGKSAGRVEGCVAFAISIPREEDEQEQPGEGQEQ